MSDKETFKKALVRGKQRGLKKIYFSRLYNDLKYTVIEMDAQNLPSFQAARDAYLEVIHGIDDVELQATAYETLTLCYADIEFYEEAAEMKQKYDQLCEEHNLDIKT